MKIVRFDDAAGVTKPGILTEQGVVDVSAVMAGLQAYNPQQLMETLIDNFDWLKPEFETVVAAGPTLSLDTVKLRAPLPRPSKIVCCIGNYWEHAQLERAPRNLNMFLKSPDAIVGPGDTVRLPAWTDPYTYQHEAELALVFKGPAKDVVQADWKSAIFGYTLMIDVSAREKARSTWRQGSWMGKSFDTFAPMGPCIVTADEITEPNSIHIQFWNDGQLRHDYNTDDMEHRVPELVEFATGIMAMNSGDVLSCGTNHEGLGNLQDGETCVIKGEGIGSFSITVSDPLKRTWERGIYKGENTTYRGT
jgi:2-keto-4-pentenoate hydratase/2-oxohepta-3-ene-1,7-dioic acid hydratase in catechol pathway